MIINNSLGCLKPKSASFFSIIFVTLLFHFTAHIFILLLGLFRRVIIMQIRWLIKSQLAFKNTYKTPAYFQRENTYRVQWILKTDVQNTVWRIVLLFFGVNLQRVSPIHGSFQNNFTAGNRRDVRQEGQWLQSHVLRMSVIGCLASKVMFPDVVINCWFLDARFAPNIWVGNFIPIVHIIDCENLQLSVVFCFPAHHKQDPITSQESSSRWCT